MRSHFEFEDFIEILEKEYPVTVVGTGYKGCPGIRNWDYPNGLPGDDPEGEVEHVWCDLPIGPKGEDQTVDIKGMIPESMISDWETELIEKAKEDGKEKEERDWDD